MVIGNGDIANVLIDRRGAIFFASGVSNSVDATEQDYRREIDLLINQPKNKCLFYFSSLSIYTKDTRYTRHKKEMELIVKKQFKNCNIIRIGNIDWGVNPNTFINFINDRIQTGKPVRINDEYKQMISIETLRLVTASLPLKGQNEINVSGYIAKVEDLIKYKI